MVETLYISSGFWGLKGAVPLGTPDRRQASRAPLNPTNRPTARISGPRDIVGRQKTVGPRDIVAYTTLHNPAHGISWLIGQREKSELRRLSSDARLVIPESVRETERDFSTGGHYGAVEQRRALKGNLWGRREARDFADQLFSSLPIKGIVLETVI